MDADSRPISPAQIKKIHALKHEMGMSDKAYRQRLGRIGLKSCKEMTYERAKGFIYYFEQAAAKRSGRTQQRRSYGVQHITEKQMELVRALWREASNLKPGEDLETALNHLVEHKFHVSALHWLPRQQVPKLIEMLKAMKAQKQGNRAMAVATLAVQAAQ